jgi:hypothetical protein
VAAGKLGVDVEVLEIWRAEDIAPAFEALKGAAQALFFRTIQFCPKDLLTFPPAGS